MSPRLSMSELERLTALLNERLGRPERGWSFDEARGRIVSQPGHLHLGCVDGAYRIEELAEGGGTRIVSQIGTGREVYNWLLGALWGRAH